LERVEFKTLILTVDKSVFSSKSIEALGGTVKYAAELAPIVIVRVPVQVADTIVSHIPGVLHVSEDAVVQLVGKPSTPPGKNKDKGSQQPAQTVPWSISYIHADTVWSSFGVTGYVGTDEHGTSLIEVAVIDTSIDEDHPDLAQNLGFCAKVFTRGINQKIVYGSCDDDNGHGTHVAGTIAAIDNEIGVVV
jgi:subtilisin